MKKLITLLILLSSFQLAFSQYIKEFCDEKDNCGLLAASTNTHKTFLIGTDNFSDVKLAKPIIKSIQTGNKVVLLTMTGKADQWLFNLAVNDADYFNKHLNRKIKKEFNRKFKDIAEYLKADSIKILSFSYSDDIDWSIKCLSEILIKNGVDEEAQNIQSISASSKSLACLDAEFKSSIIKLLNGYLSNDSLMYQLKNDSLYFKDIINEIVYVINMEPDEHDRFNNRTLYETQKIKEYIQDDNSLYYIIITQGFQLLKGNSLKLVNENFYRIDFTIAENLKTDLCTIRIVTKKTKFKDLYPVSPKIINESYQYKRKNVLYRFESTNKDATYNFIYFSYH